MTNGTSQVLYVLLWVVVGCLAAWPLILINIRYSGALGLIDWPKARGVKDQHVPIVGASLVLLSLVALSILSFWYRISPWFLTTATIMAIVGLFDDRKPISALDKIFFQLVCVLTIVLFDPHVHHNVSQIYGPWGTFWAGFFIVGLMNAINFIDGIDGLAAIVLTFGSLGYLLYSKVFPEQHGYFIFASLIMGMMIPFFYYNVFSKKAFLGNMGSYFFSYLLATMHVSLPLESVHPLPRMAISSLCFLVPIADAAMVLTARLWTLRSPFQADKLHLHHRLVQTNLPMSNILFTFALIEVLALALGVAIVRTPVLKDSWLPVLICLAQALVSALLILFIEKSSRRRVQTYFERLGAGQPIYFLKYRLAALSGKPITAHILRRVQARLSSEIRVTDICYVESPDRVLLSLQNSPEAMKGLEGRIKAIFDGEGLTATCVVEQGEFTKVGAPQLAPA